MNIVISGDMGGAFTICAVSEQHLPASVLAQMRRFGQNDCGKRQSLIPLQCSQYPDFLKSIDNKVLEHDPILPTEGPIRFWGNPQAAEQAREVALLLAEFEKKNGRQVEFVSLDRSIPCV